MYKTVIDYDKNPTIYEIDEHCNLRYIETKKEIKVYYREKGRPFVCINWNNEKCNNVPLYRILMVTWRWTSNCRNLEVNHIDGNPSNNELSNLEWCTRDENMKHAAIHCLIPFGERHHNSKYNDNLINNICLDIARGLTRQQIFHLYHDLLNEPINFQLIDDIKSGRSHKHISEKYIPYGFSYNEYNKDLKESLYRQICELLLQNKYNNKEIAKIVGVNECFVSDIKAGRKGKKISREYGIIY